MSGGPTPDPTPSARPSVRLARWCAAVGGVGWVASVLLLEGHRRAGMQHPAVVRTTALFGVTVAAAVVGVFGGLRRSARGAPRRFVWVTAAALPLVLWAVLVGHILRTAAAGRSFPKDPFSDLALELVSTVLGGGARLAYPHRLESDRLIMYYDDRVTDTHRDLAEMDRHVAGLEALTGRPPREKIHLVRGTVLGRGKMAVRGVALGSARSPADLATADHEFGLSLDRHELAHAVVHQLQPPDADPPVLLIEAWAESQSGMPARKRFGLAKQSRVRWAERTGAGPADSYLRELTGPDWYHRVGGPHYDVGGALAEFVVARYGAGRFLRWYFACRPGTVADACRAELGVPFDALGAEFWAEVERRA